MSNVVYNQHSAPWGPLQLGFTPGATIAQFGCLDSCFAMAVTDRFGSLDPGAMNEIFKINKIYMQGDLLPSNALTLADPVHWKTDTYRYKGIPADLSKLAISPDQVLIVEVDFDHDPADGIQTHFVESLGWPMIKDPWFGDWVDFNDRYGNKAPIHPQDPATTIQQIIVITPIRPAEPIVAPPVIVDPCVDLKTKLAASEYGLALTQADLKKALAKIKEYQDWLKLTPQ